MRVEYMPLDPADTGYWASESFPPDAAAVSFWMISWDTFAENSCGDTAVARRATAMCACMWWSAGHAHALALRGTEIRLT